MRRRTIRQASQLAGAALTAAGEKLVESTDRYVADAAQGDDPKVRAQRESAEKLRRQAAGFLDAAAEADAKGKTGKADRNRKSAARALRQAEEWDRKADESAAAARAWAAERGRASE